MNGAHSDVDKAQWTPNLTEAVKATGMSRSSSPTPHGNAPGAGVDVSGIFASEGAFSSPVAPGDSPGGVVGASGTAAGVGDLTAEIGENPLFASPSMEKKI